MFVQTIQGDSISFHILRICIFSNALKKIYKKNT